MRNLFSQQGSGLLEAVIAVAIITTALSGIMALTSYNLTASDVSAEQVVAVNLAREGVEVIRSMRDSNWLAGATWDTGFAPTPSDHEATAQFIPSTNTWTIDYTADDYTDVQTSMYREISPGTYAGTWQQGFASEPSNVTDTIYQRLLYINPICANRPDEYSGGSCGSNLIGYRVYSEVQWTSGDTTRTVGVQERLFNWK